MNRQEMSEADELIRQYIELQQMASGIEQKVADRSNMKKSQDQVNYQTLKLKDLNQLQLVKDR